MARELLESYSWETGAASIGLDRLMRAVEASMFDLSMPGFCLNCGSEADGIEPDAESYHCEACGANRVFGAELILSVAA